MALDSFGNVEEEEEDDFFSDYLKQYEPELFQARQVELKRESLAKELTDVVNTLRGLPEPTGAFSTVIDVLSRGNFGAAKFADVLVNDDGDLLSKLWKATKQGANEIFNPEERLLYSDVIKRANPVWAANHTFETESIGFMLDVVVDPINLFSAGAGGVFRGATRIIGKGGKLVPLSKKGKQVFTRLADEAGEAGLVGVEQLRSANQIMQEILEPGSLGKIEKLTVPEREIRKRQLIAKVHQAHDTVPGNSGAFLADYTTIRKLNKNKGAFKSIVTPTQIQGMKEAAKRGDSFSEFLLDAIIDGAPKIEVSALESLPYVNRVAQFGKTKGRQIGVIVPQRYISKVTMKRDQVGISRMFASTALDPGDLRYIVDDSDLIMDFKQLVAYNTRRTKFLKTEKVQRTTNIARAAEIRKADALDPTKLIDQGGLKFLGKSVLSTQGFKDFANTLGIPRALNAVSVLPGFKQLGVVAKGLHETLGLQGILERHFPEWVRQRRHIEAQRHDALLNAGKAYDSIFSGLNKESRDEINEFLAFAAEETKKRAKDLKVKSPSFRFGQKIFQELFSASKLSTKQKAATVKLRQSYQNMWQLEREAGIIGDFYVNYHPIRYEAINSASRYIELRRWQSGQPIRGKETFTKSKKFATEKEAALAGYRPLRDAGQLYTMRFIEGQASLRRAEWEAFIKHAYGKGKVPKLIDMDLVRLGEKYYEPRYGELGKLSTDLFNFINGMFRKSATVVRPAFAAKQVVGNTFQVFATLGTDALRVFDPTVMGDSFGLMANNGIAKFAMRDVWGITYSAEEITEMIKSFPVRKNVAMENIGFITEHQLVKKLTSELHAHNMAKGGVDAGVVTKAGRGMQNLFSKGFAYLQIPSFVEDTFRVGTFLSAIRAGNSPHAAMELVDKALFNYTSGLTKSEQFIRRGIIPFYSFNKFGTALLGSIAGTAPGRLAIEAKVITQFFESWNLIAGGDQLTEAQRSVLPPYLLEQPNVFEKFAKYGDEVQAVFRTFNNMVFFDVLNTIQVNERGGFDAEETLVKGALSQLSPFWKIPLEVAVIKRSLFTERALQGVYAGRAGNLNYDKFVRNIGIMAGFQQGAGGALIGGVAMSALARSGPGEEVLKDLIGWEEGTDRNGDRYVYINPYMMHIATSLLPGLNTAFRASRDDNTLWDNVLYANFGIAPAKFNLEEAATRKARGFKAELNKLKREYRTYLREGRTTAADIARKDMQDLLDFNETEVDKWMSVQNPNLEDFE